ncbi:Factor-induced gene 1 protein [Candida viswanathii]|uniref:Factor-induced gene 1 protein n=1 Tax=Candida viswanathii TaxID=5486 RepID=A0A367XVX0_9ASCO|nr:Factor-induced gene 1 protein [Candida viswanathii]
MTLLSKGLIVLTVVIQFIATVLLSFLLLGCIDSSSSYSNVYLLNYKFNLTSPLYDSLSTQSNSSINSTSLDDLSVRVGYMGVCLSLDDDLTCTTYDQLQSFPSYSISIMSASLDLVQLAESFSSICHPRILLATIVLTLISLILLCYLLIPLVPGKFLVTKINALFTFLNLLLWGLGSMLQHQAVNTSAVMMQESSFQLLVGSSGGRAEAMTWTAFSFILIVFLSMCFGTWSEFRRRRAAAMVAAPPPVMQKV